jgi:hypothetical protein
MRKTEVVREGKNLKFLVDSKPLYVKWDASVVEAALKTNQLYPKMRDQLLNTLKIKLEDCTPRLEAAEITALIKAAKAELGL